MGLTQLFTLILFAPGQQPARCCIYRAIVICEMSDPWPDMMTKFIISPAKSSTGNKLLRGVIREGCLAVAWDTVISPRPLTGLRILCNQIYLRQLCTRTPYPVVVERLSTDIEWLVEIHCSSDDRSGRSVHRFIIILEDFIIFSYVSIYPRFFTNILGFFLNNLTDLSRIFGLFIPAAIFTGSEHFR